MSHNQNLNFRYSEGEIHFNLMAVVGDRKMKYQKALNELAEVSWVAQISIIFILNIV